MLGKHLLHSAAILIVIGSAQFIWGQTTTFTYQGKLTDNGNPASGQLRSSVHMWDAASGGIQQPQRET